jgi:hypothetical protein
MKNIVITADSGIYGIGLASEKIAENLLKS